MQIPKYFKIRITFLPTIATWRKSFERPGRVFPPVISMIRRCDLREKKLSSLYHYCIGTQILASHSVIIYNTLPNPKTAILAQCLSPTLLHPAVLPVNTQISYVLICKNGYLETNLRMSQK